MDERRRWSIFALATSVLNALTIVAIILSLPSYYQVVAIFVGSVSVIIWWYGVFRGKPGRLRISFLLTSLLFVISIADQVFMSTLINAFPIQLLAFILLLFNVEIMPLVAAHHKLHRDVSLSNDLAQKSWKIITAKISSLALVFSACYMLTITAMSLGVYIYAFIPVVGDTSIYLIIVFVFLALFVTLREGSTFDKYRSDKETG